MSIYTLFADIPIPRDIPLAMPLPEWLLAGLLLFSFLLHILFVNLMLGGSLITLWAEIKGRKNPDYEVLAKDLAKTITVNKSLAVVLGVAPLLSINALYTVHFYSANALTGNFWIMIVPFVTVAFLLLYWHKYSREKMRKHKKLHIAILAAAVVLLLFVPLIFLTNINLMLYPDQWGKVDGFFSAMMLDNVFPRYLHFLAASLAITGLFLFGWMNREKYNFRQYTTLTRTGILRRWYKFALHASIAQLAFGPLVLLTLRWENIDKMLILIISVGIVIAIAALVMLWREVKGPDSRLGTNFYFIAAALSVTVLFMGTGRHVYRAVTLSEHRQAMQEQTVRYLDMSREAMLSAEKASDIYPLEIRLEDKLTRANRMIIYRKLKVIKGISDISFDLKRDAIILKYQKFDISPEYIYESIKNLNFKIIEDSAAE
ncbi:MAG: cytochrome C [Candidatus Kapaibacterium sp.]